MNRSIVAGGICTIVVVSTGVGWFAATKVKSPAQLAAAAAPPEASLITYPVEKRILSADLIVRGTMRYSDPISVVLAPSLLRPQPVLVSVPPVKGNALNEGDVALVVSGRPVFALRGATPGYRDLGPGTEGADVRQLEEVLVRKGLDPGPVDGRFDAATGIAVAAWYEKAGYAPFGPNELQRTNLRLSQTAVSQATDRLLQARHAELVNRSGAKPADIVDAKAAVAAAVAAIEAAKSTQDRNASRGIADIALKEADVNTKEADVATKEATVQSATLSMEDGRRRAELVAQGRNASTGLTITTQQLTLLRDVLDEANAAAAAAESDVAASEAVVAGVRATGEAVVADAQTKVSAARGVNLEGLSLQGVQDALSIVNTAQSALVAAQAGASRDNNIATADLTLKKNNLVSAKARAAVAAQRLEVAKSGVDPVTGLPIVTPSDVAASQLLVKQTELALHQAQLALGPARMALGATQGDREATRHSVDLTAATDARAIAEGGARLESARARLVALSAPGADGKTLAEAARVAQAELARLTEERNKTAAAIGVQVPANEIVFFPSLPLRIDDTKIKRGDPAAAEVMTVSGTRLAIDSSLLTTEAPLTKLDAPATIESPDFGYTSPGHISFVADKAGLRGTDAQHIYIEITPDDAPTQLVGASVRITIPTKTTNGEALVVPVSALSVRADGSTQLQIEDQPGSIRTAVVTAGLSAQGFVEIIPVSGGVSVGDRVVIGTKGGSSTTPGTFDAATPIDAGSAATATDVPTTVAPTTTNG